MSKTSIFDPGMLADSAGQAPAWAAASQAEGYGYGPHMMWWGGGWFGMALGSLFMVLLLGLLVAAIVALVRGLGGTAQSSGTAPSPGGRALDILKERFARGEIEREEFDMRRRALSD